MRNTAAYPGLLSVMFVLIAQPAVAKERTIYLKSSANSKGRIINVDVGYDRVVESLTPKSSASYLTGTSVKVYDESLSGREKVYAVFNSNCISDDGKKTRWENPDSQGQIKLVYDKELKAFVGNFDKRMMTYLLDTNNQETRCTTEIAVSVAGEWLVDPWGNLSFYQGHNFRFYNPLPCDKHLMD